MAGGDSRSHRSDSEPAMPAGSDVPQLPPATSWRVVILCALVCLLDGYDMVVAPVGTPAMASDWGIDPAGFAVALAASVLGTGVGSAVIAPLGDRFGRRPLVILSFALVGLSSLVTPLVATIPQLTVIRFITGIAMGASLANALALTSEYAVTRWRSRILACVYASSALGGALGGLIAPSILNVAGWQGIYAVGGALPLLLVPVLFFFLSESRHFLQLKASAGTPEQPTAAISEGAFDGLASLFASSYRNATIVLWLLFFLATFTTYMLSSWLPTLMHMVGWSMENSVRAVMTFSFGGILGGFFLSWMVDAGKVRTALLLGFGLTGCALFGTRIAPDHIALWMALTTMMGAGTIGAANALTAVAAIVYPTSLRASGIGAAGALGRFGATVAPLMGGALIALEIPALGILSGLVFPMGLALLIVLIFSGSLELSAVPEPASGP